MHRTSLKRIYTMLFALITTGVVLMLTIFTVKLLAEHRQSQFADEFLHLVRHMEKETKSNLNDLNQSLPSDFCGDYKMRAMRQQLFKSRYAKEIAFYQQNTRICDTSNGFINSLNVSRQPDFISAAGYQIWLNTASELFDSDYPAYVIKFINYHVVIVPIDIMSLEFPDFQWQWIYRDHKQVVELYGTDGLYNSVHTFQQASIDLFTGLTSITSLTCADDITYCVVTKDSLMRHLSTWVFAIFIIGSVLSMAGFYWLGHLIISYYYSTDLRIKRGIKRKSFYPLFQPIVELQSGKIIGCEVLARFKDELGALQPDEFIPRILHNKQTVSFTRGMLKSAMGALIRQNALPEGFKVNFNIFPNDLTVLNSQRLARQKILFSSRFQLCFEITEDEPFKNETAQAALRKLKEVGAEVAIDDFGTGYSNLTQLQSIPFDYLKIDKSFCIGLERSAFRASLVPQIVKIADTLDVPVVAEGVETQTQRKILLKEGVKLAQGFFFSRPLRASHLNQMVLKQQNA